MNSAKKVLSVILSALFVLSLCGCAQSGNETPADRVTKGVEEVSSPTQENDVSDLPSKSVSPVFDFTAFERQVYEKIPAIAQFAYTTDYYNEDLRLYIAEGRPVANNSDTYNTFIQSLTIDIFREPLPLEMIDLVHVGDFSAEVYEKLSYPNFLCRWNQRLGNEIIDERTVLYKFYMLENGMILKLTFFGGFSHKYWNGEIAPGGTQLYTLAETKIISPEELLADAELYKDLTGDSKQYDPRDWDEWRHSEWPEIFVTKYGMV